MNCHFERVVGDEVDELEILSGSEEALVEACQENVPPFSCQIGVGRVGLNRQGSHSSEVLRSVPLRVNGVLEELPLGGVVGNVPRQ